MKPQRHLLLFGSLLCAITNVKGQSVGPSTINTTGSSVIAGGIVHEYSIGQTMSGSTFTGSNMIITPDVLQPASTTGVNTPGIAASSLQVFPSPMENTLYLNPAFSSGGTLHYSIYDAAGKLIFDRETILKTGSEQQSVSVAQLAAGDYILHALWTQSGITYANAYKLQKLR
jgi:hypothetical protein